MIIAARATSGSAPVRMTGCPACGCMSVDLLLVADVRQLRLNLGAVRFFPRGQLEPATQIGHRLIYREAGLHGRDLEQHAARLAEVNGLEVLAVAYGRHLGVSDELLTELQL